MKAKVIVIVVSLLLLLIVVPVIFAQVAEGEERRLQIASLEDARYEEVSFGNEAHEIMLAGMLFLPEGDGPYPAAVLIHGAGTSVRDNNWYLTLAYYLQENGIAVLLPDKRGSVKSQGDWRSASFEDLATDSVAAVSYLKGRGDLPISQVGIVGMSQGGHLSPVVATLSPDVFYVVNVVGAAVPIHEQLLYEENNNLRQMGLLPGISNLVAYPAAWSIRELRQKEFWEAVGNYDPLPYWEMVGIEVLALYGAEDTNVPSIRSAARLATLSKENIDVRIYEGSGHALEDPPGQGNRKFRLEALQAIREFILSVE